MTGGWRERARELRRDVMALYLACRDPRVPWYAKAFAAVLVAYALSPIDLIPDFIPVIGYLDELVLLPLGVILAVKMLPADILAEHRERARLAMERPTSWLGAALIVGVWMFVLAVGGVLVARWLGR
jgi:uncharacterized membrane protein YkvA (DUF1232 family)